MGDNDLLCCEGHELHEDSIKHAGEVMPADDKLRDAAELFKLFSDFSRIKLMYLLVDTELCVCDITQLMDINQSAVSNHLRLLRQSKLVKCRREGKNTFYSLADDHVLSILRQGMEHINE